MNTKTLSLKAFIELSKINPQAQKDLTASVKALSYSVIKRIYNKSGSPSIYKLLTNENGVTTLDDVAQTVLLNLIENAPTSQIFVTYTPNSKLDAYGDTLKTIDDARQAAAAKITALKAVKKATADADTKKAIERQINHLTALVSDKNAEFSVIIDAIQINDVYLFFPDSEELMGIFRLISRTIAPPKYVAEKDDDDGGKKKMAERVRVSEDDFLTIPTADDVSLYDIQQFINSGIFSDVERAFITALQNGYTQQQIADAIGKSRFYVITRVEAIRRKFSDLY